MIDLVDRMVDVICSALDEKKLENILILDIREQTVIADYFVLCDGRSSLQVQAGSDAVEDAMATLGQTPRRMEGYAQGRWIVQDYGDVIVHIFHKEERDFYNLERLWKRGDNCKPYPYIQMSAPAPAPDAATSVDAAI